MKKNKLNKQNKKKKNLSQPGISKERLPHLQASVKQVLAQKEMK